MKTPKELVDIAIADPSEEEVELLLDELEKLPEEDFQLFFTLWDEQGEILNAHIQELIRQLKAKG